MATIKQEGFDPVKKASLKSTNKKIEKETWQRVEQYQNSSTTQLTDRIHELEKEWDIEKYLGINMGTLALGGLAAGVFTKNRNWFTLPAVVLGFFIQHSIQGYCPPLTIMRMLKLRTRKEIEEEKYALKVLRGDFENINLSQHQGVETLKQAVKKS